MNNQGELTDKTVWENYYKGKSTLREINNFINRSIFDREIIDLVKKYTRQSKGTIVEMGCGGSEWLPYIAKHSTLQVNGIDYLPTGCRTSEELLELNNVKDYKIYCADFFEFYKAHRKTYDYVVSFGVVEHFVPPVKAISAFNHYLNDDGILITTCPNTGGSAMALQRFFDKQVYDNHVKFTLTDFINFHKESGYSVLHASYTGFLSFNNLVFSNFSLLGRLAKVFLKLANAPLVFFFFLLKKHLKIDIQSKSLSSNMIVVAKKSNLTLSNAD